MATRTDDLFTYADVPLTHPDPEVLQWVQERHRIGDLIASPRPRAGQSLVWPFEELAHLPVRVGRLLWPQGASRFAFGFWLATDEQLREIRYKVKGSFGGYGAQTLRLGDGTNYIETEMYMLPPRPLTEAPGGTLSGRLWLLPLVDDRYWWWWRTAAITINPGVTTWGVCLNGLATALGVTVRRDSIPSAYLRPHPAFTTRYEYVPPMLDAAARAVGCRIVRHLDGTVWLENTTRAHEAEAANRRLYPYGVAGGELDLLPGLEGDTALSLPSAVTVVHWILSDGVPTNNTQNVTVTLDELRSLRPSLQQARGHGVGTPHHHSLACAVYAEGVWTNEEAIEDLDRALVGDWYEWQMAYTDRTYPGIVPWTPTGLNAWVEWGHDGETGEARTSVHRHPHWESDELYLTYEGGYGVPPWGPQQSDVVSQLTVLDKLLVNGLEVTGRPHREPKYQVVYGTGATTAIDSSEYFKFYYDTTQNLSIGTLGDLGFGRVTIEGTGPLKVRGICVTDTGTNGTDKTGAAVVGARALNSSDPFTVLGAREHFGGGREVYIGGGLWTSGPFSNSGFGLPSATSVSVYVDPDATENADAGVLAFSSDAVGNHFRAIAADAIPLLASGVEGQTADLFHVVSPTGNSVVVSSNGYLKVSRFGGNARAPLDIKHGSSTVNPDPLATVIVEAGAPLINLLCRHDNPSQACEIAFGGGVVAKSGRIVYEDHGIVTADNAMKFYVSENEVLRLNPTFTKCYANQFQVTKDGLDAVSVVPGGLGISSTNEPYISFGVDIGTRAEIRYEYDGLLEGDIDGLRISSSAFGGGSSLKFDVGRLILSGSDFPSFQPCFSVYNGEETKDGVTGFNFWGDEFSGGICVGFGDSGSIVNQLGTIVEAEVSETVGPLLEGLPALDKPNLWIEKNTFQDATDFEGDVSVDGTVSLERTTTGSDPVVSILQDHASGTGPALRVGQDGTGAIQEWQSGGQTVMSVTSAGWSYSAGSVTQVRTQVTNTNSAGVVDSLWTNDTGTTLAFQLGGSARPGTIWGVNWPNFGRFTNTAGPIGVGTDSAQPLYLATSSTVRATITSGGSVGVGTLSPSEKLEVAGGGPVRIAVTDVNNSVKTAVIAQNNLGVVGTMSNTPFGIIAGNNTRVYVSGNGTVSVGKGASAAGAQFEVYRNDNTSVTPVALVHQDHATSNQNALRVVQDAAAAGLVVTNNGGGVAALFTSPVYNTQVALSGVGVGVHAEISSSNSGVDLFRARILVTDYFRVRGDGLIILPNLPTSDPGVAGAVWRDAGGVLRVSAG